MIPIIVTGFGRCGSSLAMQMLSAGGVLCMGQAPQFEDLRASDRITPEFWAECQGRAVKVLDIHRVRLPGPAKVIVMTRDLATQAASQLEFGRFLGLTQATDRNARRALKRQLHTELPHLLKAATAAGREDTQWFRFEDVLSDPLREARRLFYLLNILTFDIKAAAEAVRPREAHVHGMAWELGIGSMPGSTGVNWE